MYDFDPEAAVRIVAFSWFILGFLLWPLSRDPQTRTLYFVCFFFPAIVMLFLGETREFVRKYADLLAILAAIVVALWLLGGGN